MRCNLQPHLVKRRKTTGIEAQLKKISCQFTVASSPSEQSRTVSAIVKSQPVVCAFELASCDPQTPERLLL
jgi:hypothetical protein